MTLLQERVLVAALRLLEAPSGPVLADYPEDAPPVANDAGEGQVCPVSFAREVGENNLGALFEREVLELMPWNDLARERRGRTSVGLSGLPIAKTAGILAEFLGGAALARFDGSSAGETLKLLIEDVRTYYYEAAAARPGAPDAAAIHDWFWRDTAAGRAFLKLNELCTASDDKSLRRLTATSIVPRSVLRSAHDS